MMRMGDPMGPIRKRDSRYQTRLIQHEAQQRVVYGKHETLPEEEDAVMQGRQAHGW